MRSGGPCPRMGVRTCPACTTSSTMLPNHGISARLIRAVGLWDFELLSGDVPGST